MTAERSIRTNTGSGDRTKGWYSFSIAKRNMSPILTGSSSRGMMVPPHSSSTRERVSLSMPPTRAILLAAVIPAASRLVWMAWMEARSPDSPISPITKKRERRKPSLEPMDRNPQDGDDADRDERHHKSGGDEGKERGHAHPRVKVEGGLLPAFVPI